MQEAAAVAAGERCGEASEETGGMTLVDSGALCLRGNIVPLRSSSYVASQIEIPSVVILPGQEKNHSHISRPYSRLFSLKLFMG